MDDIITNFAATFVALFIPAAGLPAGARPFIRSHNNARFVGFRSASSVGLDPAAYEGRVVVFEATGFAASNISAGLAMDVFEAGSEGGRARWVGARRRDLPAQ